MKSLFIVSLPRSLSTEIHTMCCAALGLKSPVWTSAGEVLNADRSVLSGGRGLTALKFTLPQSGGSFAQIKEYLSHVVVADNYSYKDVVQPFVSAQWLRENPDIPVLKIRPNITHVAYAMLSRNWLYPMAASAPGASVPERMVAGLLRAAQELDQIPGEVVDYDDLMFDLGGLWDALGRLYPGQTIQPQQRAQDFESDRREVLRRRSEPGYLALRHLERQMTHADLADTQQHLAAVA